MRAALEQVVGVFLGTRTVGRMLKANRDAEGLAKPKRSPHTKREMPFEASLGYARPKHWRIYGEEGLARCAVAL